MNKPTVPLTPPPLAPHRSRLPFRIAGLVWAVLFTVWFYSFVLPNGHLADGTAISRSDLWRILSDLLLENLFPTQEAASPPSGWRYLPQRFDLLAVAGVIVAGAWGLGHLALRLIGLRGSLDRFERTVFALGLGLSGLSLMTMICGVAGMLNRWGLGGAIVLLAVGEGWCRLRERRADSGSAKPQAGDRGPREISMVACATLVIVAPFVMAMLLGAMLPSTDFDVKEYHLQGPKEFFQQGRVTFLPHNVYTSFPFLTEMLSLLGMVLRDDWYRGALAGKVVLMTFAPLTALGLFAAGRRWFNSAVGWLAVLVYLTTPWVYRMSIIAYAEGGLTFYLFVSLLAVMKWQSAEDDRQAVRFTLLAGLLAGSAVACKYPGVLSVAIPFGGTVVALAALRSRQQGSPEIIKRTATTAAVFAVGTLVTFGPWMLKNVAETGNPVYPLLYTIFGGEDWNDAMNAKWRAGHSPPTGLLRGPSQIPGDLLRHAVDVAAKSDWQSPLIFAFAPLALLWRGRRGLVLGLWAYILWLFLTWWGLTHRIDRFWIPLLPVAGLLAGVGLGWIFGAGGEPSDRSETKTGSDDVVSSGGWGHLMPAGGTSLIVLAAALFDLGFITSPLCGYNAYLIDLDVARQQAATPSMRLLNELPLPKEARVLFVGEAQVFDARFEHVYNTVFDESIFQRWTSASVPGLPDAEQPLRPMAEIRTTFAEHGITHLFVNWQEVQRYRETYGYTEFVTPERFRDLVAGGVLREIPFDPSWGFQLFTVE